MQPSGAGNRGLGGLLMFAFFLAGLGSLITFGALSLEGMNFGLIDLRLFAPDRPMAPKEHAAWVVVVGISLFIGWAVARSIYLFITFPQGKYSH
jgi:hypothetical protein